MRRFFVEYLLHQRIIRTEFFGEIGHYLWHNAISLETAARNRTDTPNTRRSHDAVIRVYHEAGNVIEAHQHKGDFKEW